MTVTISASTTGSAKRARCSSAPRSRTSANGATRGLGATRHLLLRREQRGAQLVERVAAEQRGQQQAIGLQGAADLHQRARQVVDELQGEARDDEVERMVAKGQRLLVGPNAQARRIAREDAPRLDVDDGLDSRQLPSLRATRP